MSTHKNSLELVAKPSTFFWSLVICLFLVSCSQARQPSVLSSRAQPTLTTVTPGPTEIRPTSTPNPTQTPVVTPTVTLISPYPTKQVLLDYDVLGSHTPFDLFYTDHGWSKLVIYTDGQLIIPSKQTKQKMLAANEIKKLLSRLEYFKFFELESNQAHDPTDKLYNMGDRYFRVYDAHLFCVLVNAETTRKLCAYEPFLDFLVPEMKSILKTLDRYNPGGMSLYSPDRILLWVQRGRNPYVTDLAEESILWKDNFPSLETASEKIIYVEGATAKEIYAFLNNEISFKVFSQDGMDYTVVVDVVLPHEEITNLFER
jgi:hypothetical protein